MAASDRETMRRAFRAVELGVGDRALSHMKAKSAFESSRAIGIMSMARLEFATALVLVPAYISAYRYLDTEDDWSLVVYIAGCVVTLVMLVLVIWATPVFPRIVPWSSGDLEKAIETHFGTAGRDGERGFDADRLACWMEVSDDLEASNNLRRTLLAAALLAALV